MYNDVRSLSSCEKRLTIVTKKGETFVSDWFDDSDKIVAKNVNCTIRELEVRTELINESNITERDIAQWYVSKKREDGVLYVSRHAIKRLKERNGWNRKTIFRMVGKVYKEGSDIETLPDTVKPWVMEMCKGNTCEKAIYKVYGEFVYIFSNNTLVTVLNIPAKVRRLLSDVKVNKEESDYAV